MNKFSLPQVRDKEINHVLMQVQDSLNALAANVSTTQKVQQQQQAQHSTATAKLSATTDQLSVRVTAAEETVANTLNAYTHLQPVPSSLWGVQHNLGFHPAVTVVDSTGDVVVGDVKHIDTNSLIISFSGAFSGSAYLS